MNPAGNKFNFLLYYQCALAIAVVFVFFTNIDLFLFETGATPISPVVVIVLFSLATVPLLFSIIPKLEYLPLPLILWCGGYILISLFAFLLFPAYEYQYRELRIRILSTIFIIATTLIFSNSYVVQLWARRAIFAASVMGIFNTIYNIINPTAFRATDITTAIRPAGFYVDANKTGCALIIGMIFSIGLLKPKYRTFFMLLTGFIILFTFSRGAILCWLIIVGILLNARIIPRSQLFKTAIGLGVVTVFLTLIGGGLIDNLTDLQTSDKNYREMFQRLNWLEDPSSLSDESSDSRLEVAKIGWQMFTEKPFFGNGIGSTLDLDIGISTHNMYLYFMADHGIVGAFFVPLLAYIMIHNARGESKYIGWSCAVITLLWSLFSHTVLEDRFILTMFSLMAAMTATSQVDKRYQIGHKS